LTSADGLTLVHQPLASELEELRAVTGVALARELRAGRLQDAFGSSRPARLLASVDPAESSPMSE